jgi:hypothetical protein
VAQNVVLLALLFIHRLKKLNPAVRGKPGSEYRLLTVALMLGNKFLDDNTYTNKTWAEVSGINVNEVHIMEVEFLSNMKYSLFTTKDSNSSNPASGFITAFAMDSALSSGVKPCISTIFRGPHLDCGQSRWPIRAYAGSFATYIRATRSGELPEPEKAKSRRLCR